MPKIEVPKFTFWRAVLLVILALGTTHVIPDTTANWAALVVNTVMLAVLGWIAISRWSESWAARIVGSVVAASFGVVLILLKAFVTH